MFRSFFLMVVALAVMSFAASSFLANRVAQGQRQAAAGSPQQFIPVAPAIAPASPSQSATGYDMIEIPLDRSGNYFTNAEIDGYVLRMVVDTGATYVCLSDADASAIGIRPAPTDYRYRTQTANGIGFAAKVRIDRLRLGQMEITDVEAFVMQPGALGTSLLGMSALNRLGKVEIAAGKLVLRQ